MGILDRLFRRDSGQRTDSYAEHMRPYARRARARQIDARPRHRGRLSHPELADWYRSNRLVRRIVDLPANAAANDTPQFAGPDKDFWTKLFTDLDIMPAQRSGLRWAGLFGFGACLLDFDDRLLLWEPLNLRRASKLNAITPLDRRIIWPEDFTRGPASEYFVVYNGTVQIGRVHRSRLLIYDGEDTDAMTRLTNQGCGESRVDQLRDSLARLFGAHESLGFALQTFSTFLYRVEDLDNMVANDGEKVARKLDAMDEFRHLTRMLTVDKKDEIEYKTMNLTGFPDCVNVLKEMVAIEVGYPQMILWGSSPTGSGLAAGGSSERAQWEGFIGQLRTDRLDKPTAYLVDCLSQIHKKTPPGWKFAPVLPPDQEKELKNREIQARIDGAYMTMGVYGVKTIRSRFEGDYSFETQIHPDELDPPEDSAPPKEPQFPEDDDGEQGPEPAPDDDEQPDEEADDDEAEPDEDPEKPLPKARRKPRR